MDTTDRNHVAIVNKIGGLTPDMVQEVIDFIDFLKIKKRGETYINGESLLVQQESLNKIWGSESEDLYEI